jgi:hypothetical protein
MFHVLEADGRPLCHRWIDVEARPGLDWAELGMDERCEACSLIAMTRS